MRKTKILIIGGLGFIGKNLMKKTVDKGFSVTVLTHQLLEGEKKFISDYPSARIIEGNILNSSQINELVKGQDVIFSLAGNSGASSSVKDPYKDLDFNLKGHLNILEACRLNNPEALLIFPSSRLVYGKPNSIPVDETHVLRPESIYAIHKLTAEYYYLLYQNLFNLRVIIFRISNPYGPHQKFENNNYGILNWFIHNAIQFKSIQLFGDGDQKRDFLFIDDLIDLFLISINEKSLFGKVYNVGSGLGSSLRESVNIIMKYVSDTKLVLAPWPELEKKIETGDYVSDISLLTKTVNWKPVVSLDEGIRKTIEFYKQNY